MAGGVGAQRDQLAFTAQTTSLRQLLIGERPVFLNALGKGMLRLAAFGSLAGSAGRSRDLLGLIGLPPQPGHLALELTNLVLGRRQLG